MKQDSGVVQGPVAARSRLAKTSLTIPRLELVAGHMAVNLAVTVRSALQALKITKDIHCWLDSTVAHLVKRQRRVSAIRCESCQQNKKSRECVMAPCINY